MPLLYLVHGRAGCVDTTWACFTRHGILCIVQPFGGFLTRSFCRKKVEQTMNYFRANRFLDTLPDWETGHPPDGPLGVYLPRMRALLHRLDDPQKGFKKVIVGGTNGKGTTSSLLADLLRLGGKSVGLYTSPHLHTVRERICIGGQVVSRDIWAEGVTQLYEKSRDFEREGFGAFSKFEALTALSTILFAQAGVDYTVFEVGLGGRYDATNAWDSDVAVLTVVQLDHTAVLGDTLEAITADKLHIARSGRQLFTTQAQTPEVMQVIRRASKQHGILLCEVADDLCVENRTATFCQNAALSVSAGRFLLGEVLTEDLIQSALSAHMWPGRFEVVQQTPPVILDGAHNPAAAQALAAELIKLAPKWTFVIGASAGHDAGGILKALAPLASDMILTQSTHPKAIPVADLQAVAPQDVAVRNDADGLRVLKDFLTGLPTMGPVCVTGSLYLVGLAREVLNLPYEQDSFSEDVILESLHCLKLACQNLGIGLEPISADGNVLRATRVDRPLYFLRNKHPFNDYVSGRLAEDKGYQYELFSKAGLLVPQTMTVFNPLADRRFDRYKTHASISDIVTDVTQRFSFPVVIKRNRGSMAQGVYLETDVDGFRLRLFDLCEDSSRFDNVLLIQAFVEGPEYRIVASQDRLLLAYEKRNDPDLSAEDLNPLHRAGGVAVPVVDGVLLAEFAQLTRLLNRVIDLGFYAIDLIAGVKGFSILEVNPNPICHFYNHHNGRGDFVQIYEYLVKKYMLRESPKVPILPALSPRVLVSAKHAGG